MNATTALRSAPRATVAPATAVERAPLSGVPEAEVVGFAVDEPDDAGLPDALPVDDALWEEEPLPVEDAEPEVETPMGAVEAPSIWDWTEALKVPVMLVSSNLAVKDCAGYCGAPAALRESESKRMKYCLLLGPMLRSGVNTMDLVVLTSTLSVMSWSKVCWSRLPA